MKVTGKMQEAGFSEAQKVDPLHPVFASDAAEEAVKEKVRAIIQAALDSDASLRCMEYITFDPQTNSERSNTYTPEKAD